MVSAEFGNRVPGAYKVMPPEIELLLELGLRRGFVDNAISAARALFSIERTRLADANTKTAAPRPAMM